jgi:acetylornithine deacetylase/succinyl-diaminopimelate desuccinylase-like protein
VDDLGALLADVDGIRDELIEFHRDLVRFETVNTGAMPTGFETPCCEYLKRRLDAEGIGSEILESAPGRGNLVARLGGTGGAPSLLFMSHLDVVPVEDAKAWRYPPFGAQVAEGKIWGRGSDDCKAVTTAAYFATVLLRRRGVPARGDVIFTATADEESGGFYGYGWLAEHHPEKIRADFALNEGGGMPLPSPRGMRYGIALGEKGRVEVSLSIAGRSAHASQPWLADNALVKASRAVAAIAGYAPALDVAHPVFDHLGDMVPGVPRPTVETLEDVLVRVAEIDRATASLLRAASRMTLAPTVLHAGVKSNSIPAAAVLRCDARTLPGQDAAYVRREVEQTLGGLDGVSVSVQTWARSTESPFGTPFTGVLERALRLALGREDVGLLPTLTAGFTDSQYVRPLGVQAYGFAPIHPAGDRVRSGVHGVNEQVEIDTLLVRTKVYLAAAYLTVAHPGAVRAEA